MKRTQILIIIILMLAIAGLMSSCKRADPNTPTSEKPTESTPTPSVSDIVPTTDDIQTSASASAPVSESPASPVPSPSIAPASMFDFEEKTYSEGTISIKYPQITGMSDNAAQEKLNKIISDAALRDLSFLESGTTYELNYKVTFNNSAVISMYFDGYSNMPGAAHPYQFLRSVTIDTIKLETVPLSALVSISEGFVDVLLNGKYSAMDFDMTGEYEAAIKDYITGMGNDFLLEQLRNADMGSSETSSYLTRDALVISVSVPHVMGDHVEIYLSFNELRGYQTDNLIWQEIER